MSDLRLDDAALRERAYRWCGANQTTYSEWTVDELTTAFIALRDSARAEQRERDADSMLKALADFMAAQAVKQFMAKTLIELAEQVMAGMGTDYRERYAKALTDGAALIRAQGFDLIADHKLSEWDAQGGEE